VYNIKVGGLTKKNTNMKGDVKMTSQVDVHDLPEEDVQVVQEFVDNLREKKKRMMKRKRKT